MIQLAVIVVDAYLRAAIPIGFVMLAGRMSPLYRQPWPRLALVFVATAVLVYRVAPLLGAA